MPEEKYSVLKDYEDVLSAHRFLVKILTEVKDLRVIEVSLSLSVDSLLVTFGSHSNSKKIVKVKTFWYALLVKHLRSRWFSLIEKCASKKFDYTSANSFVALCKIGTGYTSFQVTISDQNIKLDEFQNYTYLELVKFIHTDSVSKQALINFDGVSEGLVIVAATDSSCLNMGSGIWTALSDGYYLGDLKNQSPRLAINKLSGKGVFALGAIAENPALALQQLNAYKDLLATNVPIYLFFCSFPAGICNNCPGTMRLAVNQFLLDSKYDQAEWKSKQPINDQLCSSCCGYGYSGWKAVGQFIELTPQLRSVMNSQPPLSEYTSWLSSHDYTRFYDLAVELALDGKTDVAALHDCGIKQVDQTQRSTDNIEVDGDFFEEVAEVTKAVTAINKNDTQILIVEDDLDQRQILEMTLASMGYKVLLAENGLEAMGVLQKQQPNLIITDLMMPKMNGMEFVKNLKDEERYRDIGVMVLTVLSDPDKEYSLLDLGVEDYCEKTTPRKILLKRIENIIKRKALHIEERTHST